MDQSLSPRVTADVPLTDAPTITISLRGPNHGRRAAIELGAFLPTADGGLFLGEQAGLLSSWNEMMYFIMETMRPFRDGGQARMTFYLDGWRGASFGFETPSSENPDGFIVAFFDPPASQS